MMEIKIPPVCVKILWEFVVDLKVAGKERTLST